jgi:hypothetical protein
MAPPNIAWRNDDRKEGELRERFAMDKGCRVLTIRAAVFLSAVAPVDYETLK